MAVSSSVVTRPGLLASLRDATGEVHGSLDGLFSTLPMADAEGYRRFLVAHAIGWEPLWPAFERFVTHELGQAAPDYPAMLRADLAELDFDPARLPVMPAMVPDCPAAITYVLAGSRMGIAMIRRQPSWAATNGTAGRYLADSHGPGLFRALREWMDGPDGEAVDPDLAARAARFAFGVFADAFVLSADPAVTGM